MHKVAVIGDIPISKLCKRYNMSRQNYYAVRKQREKVVHDEELIISLVRRERMLQPRLGARKLRWMIKTELVECGVKIGRDSFFKLLGRHDLLVRHKPGKIKTTNSRHSLPIFSNLIVGKVLGGINQVWVSDLTYVRTEEGFVFAAVIMDLYSRKIVGSHIGYTLEAEGCIEALRKAVKENPERGELIHHSDRGCQYCCHEYVDCLKNNGILISMTEIMHCYENAAAERVIGILKQEYEMDRKFKTKEQAIAAFNQAIFLYNEKRPHMRLDYRVPSEVHKKVA